MWGGVRQAVAASAKEWRRDSHELLLFDTLLREGSAALAPHFGTCIPVFALAADAQRDAHVRSTLLVLLDHVLSDEALREPARARGAELLSDVVALREPARAHGAELLSDVVVPVCMWRAGKVAGALRKGGVACLRQLLKARLCDRLTA
ncbi:hypothetical protein T484DRAFT_1846832 [Baffinella frigidus]|nr:hypothetical protein T484DRAFT_1846832 [Cryptophyta sp. CCMP2293]